MNKCTLIVDMQFGSCGKGLISGYMAKNNKPDTVINANMQNSGHTFIDSDGRKFMLKCLPNSIVSPRLKVVLMGPGSAIDLDVLVKEVEENADLLRDKTLSIHPAALVVTKEDVASERVHNRIGSTQTGNSSSIIRRINRDAHDNPMISELKHGAYLERLNKVMNVFITYGAYYSFMKSARNVQIDGSQGFSLSPYHGMWPYVTSRDCTPAQLCADAGVPIQEVTEVVGCIRTYPIRVANRFNEVGEMVGFSGPPYPDQEEISFEHINQSQEFTTVTQLPRRLFTFSEIQFSNALAVCQPDTLFVNFMNYLSEEETVHFLNKTIRSNFKGEIITGWGPNCSDIVPF